MAQQKKARNAYDMTEPLQAIVLTEGERRFAVTALVEKEMDDKRRIAGMRPDDLPASVAGCDCEACALRSRQHAEESRMAETLQKGLDATKALRKALERLVEAPAEPALDPEWLALNDDPDSIERAVREIVARAVQDAASAEPDADRIERAARAAYPNTDFDDPELKELCDEYRTRIARALRTA